ncbi:MAG: hypothetical protein WC229_00870 [Candidatus Paceibacterota bacterium]|jgi:hypothetical protein
MKGVSMFNKDSCLPLEAIVITPLGRTFIFKFLAIKAENENELLIDSAFYLENEPKIIPTFPHFELMWQKGGKHKGIKVPEMHLHLSKKKSGGRHSNAHFLCYTGRIESIEAARAILYLWAIGTAYRAETGEDMNYGIEECGSNEAFLDQCDLMGYKAKVE